MSISNTIFCAIGRAIIWSGFLFLTAAFMHSGDWALVVASAAGATFAILPAGLLPNFTLRRKVALVVVLFVLAVFLQPDQKLNMSSSGFWPQHGQLANA